MKRFSRLLSAALLLLTALSAGAQKLPEDLTSFTDKATAALKAREFDTLKAMAETPDTLGFLKQASGRGQNNWKIAVLPLPTATQTRFNAPTEKSTAYLAVFYDFHTCESIGDHIHLLRKTPDGWRFSAEIPETNPNGYRVRDHKLTVRYETTDHAAFLTDEVLIERTTASPNEPCLVRLSSDMTIDSVRVKGKEYAAFNSVPGLFAVLPPDGGKTFTLSLAYQGKVNHPGSDYVNEKEAVLCSYWYPHIGRLPAKHGVTVTVPKGWTAVGQGELVKRTDSAESSTFSFRNEIATCYFTLDAAPYTITTREVGKRKLSAYLLRPSDTRAKASLDLLEKALAFYEPRFGPLPYTHYELVETLGPFGGALEAYSFATYGPGSLPGAVPHELAHSWWGGIVPNPYTRTLWNESFASYSDGLFRRQTSPMIPPRALTGMHQDRNQGRGYVTGFAIPMSEAFDTSNGAHSTVGYGKGSLVLAMLEDWLGTETMVQAMHRFRDDHKAGEAADWAEFAAAVQKTTKQDYGWFFAQWTERGGVPLLSLQNVVQKEENGQYILTGQVVQEGKPYRLRLPVVLDLGNEKKFTETLEISESTTTFRYIVPTKATALRLDPAGNVLLAGSKPAEEGANPLVKMF